MHCLDRGLALLAVTSDMSWLVPQETISVGFGDSWLAALLRSVPFAIEVHALYVSTQQS